MLLGRVDVVKRIDLCRRAEEWMGSRANPLRRGAVKYMLRYPFTCSRGIHLGAVSFEMQSALPVFGGDSMSPH